MFHYTDGSHFASSSPVGGHGDYFHLWLLCSIKSACLCHGSDPDWITLAGALQMSATRGAGAASASRGAAVRAAVSPPFTSRHGCGSSRLAARVTQVCGAQRTSTTTVCTLPTARACVHAGGYIFAHHYLHSFVSRMIIAKN